MPQIPAEEFERVPLRVHALLAGVPLHDAWAINLPRARAGITLEEFLRAAGARPFTLSPAAQALFKVRLFAGKLFGWDREPAEPGNTFATRLTEADRVDSLGPPGTRVGAFRVVYRFQNEQLLEVTNRTVHGAALSALSETATAYRFYFAVYVLSVGRFTPIYMSLIDPFRKLIVYPSLLRSVEARWKTTFGGS
jgi:hypothetical protein